MQSLPAAGLQLAHVPVRLPVAAADLGAELAPAHALGQPFPGRVFALQPVSARQVVLAPARFTLSVRAHQAAVAAVRHVAAGAAGARTGTHIAPCGALQVRLRDENVRQVEKERSAQEEFHGWSRSGHSRSRCAHHCLRSVWTSQSVGGNRDMGVWMDTSLSELCVQMLE